MNMHVDETGSDDAAVPNNGRVHLLGAQAASLSLAAACRQHLLILLSELRRNAFGRLPNAAGWQPALPRVQNLALMRRFLRTNTGPPYARPDRWSLDRE